MNEKKIKEMFTDYNSKLNPAFTDADTEHIVRFAKMVLEQVFYEDAMDKNL